MAGVLRGCAVWLFDAVFRHNLPAARAFAGNRIAFCVGSL